MNEEAAPENELRGSNALLQAVTQDTDDWVFIKDPNGRLALVNPAICKAFGKLPEDLVGKTLREYIASPDEAERIRQQGNADSRRAPGAAPCWNRVAPAGSKTHALRNTWTRRAAERQRLYGRSKPLDA